METFGFPQKPEAQQTGRVGEIFAQYTITSAFGWIFRPVHREDDFGIDGYIDLAEDNCVTGKSLAIQIKTGDSYFSQRTAAGFKYTGSKQHLNLYLNLDLPVILLITNPVKEEAYWVEFEIEKTTETKSGWWIEIPVKNVLAPDTKGAWKKIAGPSVDYSEEIQNFWALSKLINESSFFGLAIPREEVEGLSYHTVNMFFSKLSKNSDMLLAKRNSVEIFFPDYDSDPRELHEIPEFRKWMAGSLHAGIPWFYFLNTSPPAPSLMLLYGCGCEIDVVERQERKHYISTKPEDRLKWLETNFHNLNVFADENGISDEINKAVCDAVTGRYLGEMDKAQSERN